MASLHPMLRAAAAVAGRRSLPVVTNCSQQHVGSKRDKCSLGGTDVFTSKQSNKKKEKVQQPSTTGDLSFADATLRGVGQVIFLNSPYAGTALIGGLAVGDPYLATLAAVGAATSTAVAQLSRLDSASLRDGLWGYNGCLIGCAAAVFISPLSTYFSLSEDLFHQSAIDSASAGLAATVFGAVAAPFVSSALKPAMGNVPQWTLAFNCVTLGTLLRTGPLVGADSSNEAAANALLVPEVDPIWLAEVPLKGVSQIFVVESGLSGAIILGGTTALYSPGLALHAVVGSTVGAATGYVLGAPLQEIGMGLWGFNSALTSMGVGTFFNHSNKAVALSAGGAAATAVLFGAMKAVFGSFDAPCLTLPFCATMSGCYLLGIGGAVPGLTLAMKPHSPERNE